MGIITTRVSINTISVSSAPQRGAAQESWELASGRQQQIFVITVRSLLLVPP